MKSAQFVYPVHQECTALPRPGDINKARPLKSKAKDYYHWLGPELMTWVFHLHRLYGRWARHLKSSWRTWSFHELGGEYWSSCQHCRWSSVSFHLWCVVNTEFTKFVLIVIACCIVFWCWEHWWIVANVTASMTNDWFCQRINSLLSFLHDL